MMIRRVVSMAVVAWLGVVGVGCGPQEEGEPGLELGTQQEALYNVVATSRNITVLQNSCYSSGYMLWDRCSLGYGGQDLYAYFGKVAYYIGTIKGTKVSNGQCAAFVINMVENNGMYASGWKQGVNVMTGNVARGTAIATFTNGAYDSVHSAIFQGYRVDSMGKRIGFYVWDSNYNGNLATMMHSITTGSSRYQQASQYYVVQY